MPEGLKQPVAENLSLPLFIALERPGAFDELADRLDGGTHKATFFLCNQLE